MDSLGLDLAALRARHPRLVTVSLPGFASDDAEHAHLKAYGPPAVAPRGALICLFCSYDGVVAAVTGVFTDMGLDRVLEGYNPCFTPLPQVILLWHVILLAAGTEHAPGQASVYGAVLASVATVAALCSRESTGIGDQIEVPLASALLEGLCYNSWQIDNLPERCIREPGSYDLAACIALTIEMIALSSS